MELTVTIGLLSIGFIIINLGHDLYITRAIKRDFKKIFTSGLLSGLGLTGMAVWFLVVAFPISFWFISFYSVKNKLLSTFIILILIGVYVPLSLVIRAILWQVIFKQSWAEYKKHLNIEIAFETERKTMADLDKKKEAMSDVEKKSKAIEEKIIRAWELSIIELVTPAQRTSIFFLCFISIYFLFVRQYLFKLMDYLWYKVNPEGINTFLDDTFSIYGYQVYGNHLFYDVIFFITTLLFVALVLYPSFKDHEAKVLQLESNKVSNND